MKNSEKNKEKEISYSNESPKAKKIFPIDHPLFRTIEFAIRPILVVSFISFKMFNILGVSSGKIRLMMTDTEKALQSCDQV